MKKLYTLAAVSIICLTGCTHAFKPIGAGSSYDLVEHHSGALIKEGDFVGVRGQIRTDNDSLINSTYELGKPTIFVLTKSQFRGDLTSAFNLLAEGDSAIIKLPVDTMLKKIPGQRRPQFKSKYITYYIRVEKVIPKEMPENEAIFNAKISAYLHNSNNQLKSAEPGRITKYLADHNLKTVETASGLRYVIEKKGEGPLIEKGDTAVINYVGEYTSGKVYGTNIREEAVKAKLPLKKNYEPVKVAVGSKQVIDGWDEALLQLRNKSTSILVVPSKLAYDERGNGPIPAYTPLVFKIQVVNVIHAKKGV